MTSLESGQHDLRVAFAGSPPFAATILDALVDAGVELVAVYTQPDRPAGRGRRLTPSAVKRHAATLGVPIEQPASLRSAQAIERFSSYRPDVFVVAAYGLILPPPILAIPRLGCINVHASLLPRWRGAAPIERAILAGDTVTGVSIMRMDAGLDTGPVYLRVSCPIGPDTTAAALEAELAGLGAEALLECLGRLDRITPEPQPTDGATYADKLGADDANILWSGSASQIERQVRALAGRMAPTSQLDGARVRILAARAAETGAEPAQSRLQAATPAPPGTVLAADRQAITVACGSGQLLISRLQLNRGKGNPLSAGDACNGYPDLFAPGRRFQDAPHDAPHDARQDALHDGPA
ncbi:MAG: methionyl-tRNA formyltransferase [Pseudomonadales bacterium]